ncbi:MAG: hypothetical protein QM529_02150 [Hydrotalea sp.]|nr:hypothetical protein [Hydrotalea sp.]
MIPGSKYYQVASGYGFLHLKMTTLKRKFDTALQGRIDGQQGMPGKSFGLTTMESRVKDFIALTCNQNRSHRNKLLAGLFPQLNKVREEINKAIHTTRGALESKKKEFLNVSGKMAKGAPDINTTFERVREAYEKLCDFRNENFITSEKEIDLSSFRLVYPIVLAFAVFMEMLYTGFQLAPSLGLGRAYGQFGGFSVLMAFLAYEGGHYFAYYRGFITKQKEIKKRNLASVQSPGAKEFFYLPTMVICLLIMLFIMVFNFFRLPDGDHTLVVLWLLFCFFAFLHGLSGEKYPGHRNHIVMFRKELNLFKQILYVYIDQLKTIKQQFDSMVATLKESFSVKQRVLKENLDKVKAIDAAYRHCLKEILKDATGLYEIYYHSNSLMREAGFDYRERFNLINEKFGMENYLDDRATDENIKEFEDFYRDIAVSSGQFIDDMAKMADGENKTLLQIYNKKLEDILNMVKLIKIPTTSAGRGAFQSPLCDKNADFQIITKTVGDAFRNIEKDH